MTLLDSSSSSYSSYSSYSQSSVILSNPLHKKILSPVVIVVSVVVKTKAQKR